MNQLFKFNKKLNSKEIAGNKKSSFNFFDLPMNGMKTELSIQIKIRVRALIKKRNAENIQIYRYSIYFQ